MISKRIEQSDQMPELPPESLLITNKSGIITQCDERVARIFGYAQHELLGRPIESLMDPHLRERQVLQHKMDGLSHHDPLTGLVNRQEFERRLNTMLDITCTDDSEHVLCYLDLDQFKVVNDTCGHVAGDELLHQLANVIKAQTRRCDTLARVGGDGFAIFLQECGLDRAKEVMTKLCEHIRDFRFQWNDQHFGVGVSVGMVGIDRDTETAGAALSAADAACQLAKEQGRNRIFAYQANDEDVVRRHGEMRWVSRIQDAVENDRFKLRYQLIQPVVEKPGDGLHCEVLVSLRETNGGIVAPDTFLPAAERYNLSPAVDRWVVKSLFGFLQHHAAALDGLKLCTINLSGNTLVDEQFEDFLLTQFDRFQIEPSRICFEITETSTIANMRVAIAFMNKMKDIGCKFALDDFGSGMASFAYLKSLPVDYLKIDGSFVRDMASNKVDWVMVEAINKVGQVMNLETIAEFVESPPILDELRAIGVDYAQGYGIAHPCWLEDIFKIMPDKG